MISAETAPSCDATQVSHVRRSTRNSRALCDPFRVFTELCEKVLKALANLLGELVVVIARRWLIIMAHVEFVFQYFGCKAK
jgi:hypothetical protein